MKILIIADMEGISWICLYNQIWDRSVDYEYFRDLMTKEVNAAVEGAFNGGASQVKVFDYHWNGGNIFLGNLDPRAILFSGTTTLTQIKKRIEEVDGICFVGFHGWAWTNSSILEHTMDFHIHRLNVNGERFDEIALESILASKYNIPTIFVSGDHTACEYSKKIFSNIKTVVTKYSLGRNSGEMLPISEVHKNIKNEISIAVSDLEKKNHNYSSLKIIFPAKLEIEFNNGGMADKAEIMPNTTRINGQTIQYEAKDHEDLYRAFYSLQSLGNIGD